MLVVSAAEQAGIVDLAAVRGSAVPSRVGGDGAYSDHVVILGHDSWTEIFNDVAIIDASVAASWWKRAFGFARYCDELVEAWAAVLVLAVQFDWFSTGSVVELRPAISTPSTELTVGLEDVPASHTFAGRSHKHGHEHRRSDCGSESLEQASDTQEAMSARRILHSSDTSLGHCGRARGTCALLSLCRWR